MDASLSRSRQPASGNEPVPARKRIAFGEYIYPVATVLAALLLLASAIY